MQDEQSFTGRKVVCRHQNGMPPSFEWLLNREFRSKVAIRLHSDVTTGDDDLRRACAVERGWMRGKGPKLPKLGLSYVFHRNTSSSEDFPRKCTFRRLTTERKVLISSIRWTVYASRMKAFVRTLGYENDVSCNLEWKERLNI